MFRCEINKENPMGNLKVLNNEKITRKEAQYLLDQQNEIKVSITSNLSAQHP